MGAALARKSRVFPDRFQRWAGRTPCHSDPKPVCALRSTPAPVMPVPHRPHPPRSARSRRRAQPAWLLLPGALALTPCQASAATLLTSLPAWTPTALAAAALTGLGAWALQHLYGPPRPGSSDDESLCAAMLDHSQQWVGLLDKHGRILRLNQAAQRWLAPDGGSLTGQALAGIPVLAQQRTPARHLRDALERAAAGESSRIELAVGRDGHDQRLAEFHLSPIRPPGPAGVWHILLEARDITLQRQVESKLKLAAAVFEQASEGILIIDQSGLIVSTNQAFAQITGLDGGDLQGTPAADLPWGDGEERLAARVNRGLRETGHWQGELQGHRPDGQHFTVWVSVSTRLDQAALSTHLIATVSDVTQTREAEHRLHYQDQFDALTRLPNRRLLGDRLQLAMGAVQRGAGTLAVLHLDLDRFRLINDSFSRAAGDQVLQDVALQISAALRDADTVGRLGADEFAVLLPATDREGAARVAQKLLDFVSKPSSVAGHEYCLTASIGVAIYPDDADDADQLLRHAEAAMHRAKQQGQSTFEFFAAGLQEPSRRRLALEAALRRATERDELLLHYQPQWDLHTGTLTGLEALVRWQHPELGMVSPGEFIPLAESNGQILDIGAWVLREAVTQLKTWLDAGMAPTVVAVNISAVQFRDPALPELVRSVLQASGLPAHLLELELTESVATGQPAAAIAMMRRLHDLGVRLSIDDFGTGYSSLNYLKRFPIHTLKIDQSFVRDISTDADDRAIVQAIVQLAKALSLTTIAEGVETEAQAAFLRKQGCQVVQGFLYCRPLAPSVLIDWLRARSAAMPMPITPDLATAAASS
jgi:diguanylate cyclase (GGDEF)-like protein/PAS domain S-box-containing protein